MHCTTAASLEMSDEPEKPRFSFISPFALHLLPIIVCQFWGLTWDSLETYLGLTSELLNNLATYKDGNIPNASRTHPEHQKCHKHH